MPRLIKAPAYAIPGVRFFITDNLWRGNIDASFGYYDMRRIFIMTTGAPFLLARFEVVVSVIDAL